MTGGVTARSDLLPAGIQSGRRVSVENTRFQAVTFPFLLTKRSNAKQEEAVMKLCLVKEFFFLRVNVTLTTRGRLCGDAFSSD